jgi:hypothetical protein
LAAREVLEMALVAEAGDDVTAVVIDMRAVE